MNNVKQFLSRVLEFKYLKYLYMAVMVIFTTWLSYYRISLLPKWPNEVITLTLFIDVCLIISLFVFYSLKKSNKDWTVFLIIYIASFILVLFTSYISINISEFEGPLFLVPMLFTLLIGSRTSVVLNITISSVFFILLDSNVELYFYFILFGTIACYMADLFKTIKTILISTAFLIIVNVGINILFQLMVYGEVLYNILVMKLLMLIIDVAIAWIIAIFVNKLISSEYKKRQLESKCSEKYPPIIEMKNQHLDIYIHTLQVVELSVAAAKAVNADILVVRAGAMYHDIGKHKSGNYIKSGLQISRKYNLPLEVQKIISEHTGNNNKPTSIESGIVMLADTITSTIDRIEKSKGGIELSEEKLINNIINIRLESGALSDSGIDLKELFMIKEAFIKFYKGE